MERHGPLDQKLGAVVRRWRQEAGLSQERLAELSDLHRNYIGLLESGEHSPSLAVIDAVARALGRTASELVHAAEA